MIFHSVTADEGTVKRNSSYCCYKAKDGEECYGEIHKLGECPYIGTVVFVKAFKKTHSSIY